MEPNMRFCSLILYVFMLLFLGGNLCSFKSSLENVHVGVTFFWSFFFKAV